MLNRERGHDRTRGGGNELRRRDEGNVALRQRAGVRTVNAESGGSVSGGSVSGDYGERGQRGHRGSTILRACVRVCVIVCASRACAVGRLRGYHPRPPCSRARAGAQTLCSIASLRLLLRAGLTAAQRPRGDMGRDGGSPRLCDLRSAAGSGVAPPAARQRTEAARAPCHSRAVQSLGSTPTDLDARLHRRPAETVA